MRQRVGRRQETELREGLFRAGQRCGGAEGAELAKTAHDKGRRLLDGSQRR
jgi:hypothetical protein